MNTPTLLALVFVALTGDARYRVREAATLGLSHLAGAGQPISHAGPWQGDEEMKRRAWLVVERHRQEIIGGVLAKHAKLTDQAQALVTEAGRLADQAEDAKRAVDFLVEQYRPACGYFPWIDCLPGQETTFGMTDKEWENYLATTVAVAKYRPLVSKSGLSQTIPNWESSREMTRLWVRDMILDSRSPAAIRATLDYLWVNHRAYCRLAGYPVPD